MTAAPNALVSAPGMPVRRDFTDFPLSCPSVFVPHEIFPHYSPPTARTPNQGPFFSVSSPRTPGVASPQLRETALSLPSSLPPSAGTTAGLPSSSTPRSTHRKWSITRPCGWWMSPRFSLCMGNSSPALRRFRTQGTRRVESTVHPWGLKPLSADPVPSPSGQAPPIGHTFPESPRSVQAGPHPQSGGGILPDAARRAGSRP